jgi:hypothetical protein
VAEPQDAIVTALRANLTDYNSTNRVGSNWIYPDLPRVDLRKNSYPRIGVVEANEIQEVLGSGTTERWAECTFDIIVYTIGDVIGSNNQEGQQLADTIGRDVVSFLGDNWKTDSNFSGYFNFEIVENRQLPHDKRHNVFKRLISIKFNIINPGE